MGQLKINQKYYQVSKPEIEFNMMNIIYMLLRMYMHREKTTFICKDHYCKALHINMNDSPPKKLDPISWLGMVTILKGKSEDW